MTRTQANARFRAGTRIRIVYLNGSGELSDRQIRILGSYESRAGVVYLRAHCYLRGEERTFRADRIVSVLADEARPAPEPQRLPQLPRQPQRPPRPGASRPCAPPSVAPPVAPPRIAPVAPPSSSRRTSRVRGRGFLGVAALIVFAAVRSGVFDATPQTRHLVVPAGVPVAWRVSAPVVPVAPPPSPRTNPTASSAHANPEDIRRVERERRLASAMGFSDSALSRRYEAADRDQDGTLAWAEIARFQQSLQREFTYRPNAIALRPDEFVRDGGGDCEDWALLTCGLLIYWGFDAYVATIVSQRGTHAVTFVRADHAPAGSTYYTVEKAAGVPAARYVPIDYEEVGRFSNAVGPSPRVTGIWLPSQIIGRSM